MSAIAGAGPHGGDAATVARSLGVARHELIDLSMSMNPFAPAVGGLVADRLDSIHAYPDPPVACAALAAEIGVDADRLVLTNGGSEAIALVARLHPVGRIDDPEFSLYRRHLEVTGPDGRRWRSNPSNPLGRLATPGELAGSEAGVWDEAFFALATGRWTERSLDGTGAWRIGSLTKLWACPGLRLGYVIAPDAEQADALRRIQPMWSVNALALSIVAPLLAMTDLAGWATSIRTCRHEFADAVRSLGFAIRETDANWLLVDGVDDLRGALAPHGVLVRDCSNFGLAATARVAVPRSDEVDRVVAGFTHVARSR